MSKKKDRAWFVCRTWADIVSRHYATDTDAGARLTSMRNSWRSYGPARPSRNRVLLKTLRRYASRHELESPMADLVTDTRSD